MNVSSFGPENCTRTRNFINMGLDNRLLTDKKQSLTNHLEACKECNRIYNARQLVNTILSDRVL
jgi:predicted anti-sigma-YlaC factor YlaD